MDTGLVNATHGLDELPDSAPLLADHAALRQRWEDDGVLYFSQVIDPSAIAAVRNEYIARLKDVGVVAEPETQPIWNGHNRLEGKRARPIEDSIWQSLVAHPSFDTTVSSFLGEKPAWVPIIVHRSAPPADPAKTSGDPFFAGHQDGVNNYGIDFITCWVPLMEIDETVGGLAVVPGSHKAIHYNKDPGETNVVRTGVFPTSAWRRPDYKPGDLLMFHSMTAHAGLPNRSDKIRLSVDIRFLPSSGLKPVVGSITNIEGATVQVTTESGETQNFIIDDATTVRGPKGTPVHGQARSGIVFPGAAVIIAPDTNGRAKLVRSVSRKYLDLPAAWFIDLPPNWVV